MKKAEEGRMYSLCLLLSWIINLFVRSEQDLYHWISSLGPLYPVWHYTTCFAGLLICRWLCYAGLCSVTQSCPTLCDPMDCYLPGSSVHGILQARILQQVAMPSSRESSWPRDQTQVSNIAGGFFTIWGTKEALAAGTSLESSNFIIPLAMYIYK